MTSPWVQSVGIVGNVAGIASVVRASDATHDDAFSRVRVSDPVRILESKRVGNTSDVLMTTSASGTGSSTYSVNRSSTSLTVASGVGAVTRQTRSRGIYQPGKSMLLFQTFVLAPAQANLTQQVGYFDDKNGVFLRRSGAAESFVRRSFVSGVAAEEVVPRASWNVDSLDGTGASGVNANLDLAQILFADFEWLGAGRVRCGLVIDGHVYLAHSFNNANRLSSVYMTNPNLPIRWQITSSGTLAMAASLEAICGSLSSEGGYTLTGVEMNANTTPSGTAYSSNQTKEIMAIRVKSEYVEFSTAYLLRLNVMTSTSTAFSWRIVSNPTATAAGTWSSAHPESVMEVNTTRTVTDGTGRTITSGYENSASSSASLISDKPPDTLGASVDGVQDVLSVIVSSFSGQNETFFASIGWREVY